MIKGLAIRAENIVASLALGGVMLLPLAEITSQKLFSHSIDGAAPLASNLLIWVALCGAAIAAREGKLLTLATGEFIPKGRLGELAHILAGFVAAGVTTIFALSSMKLLDVDRTSGEIIAMHIPKWVADLALPIGFALIALRLVWRASPHWIGRAIALLGIGVGFWVHGHPDVLADLPVWPWIAGVAVGALLGGPIFALLGGIAVFATIGLGNRPVTLLIRAQDTLTSSSGPGGDSAVHARGIPTGRREIVGTLAAHAARVVRVGAGWHGDRGCVPVRVLHPLHRRLGA